MSNKISAEEAATLDAEDLGGDALAYFLTGFHRGSAWQSTQSVPREHYDAVAEEVQRQNGEISTLFGALAEAKQNIKNWYEIGGAKNWEFYDRNSPEMKRLNAVLTQSKPNNTP